MLRHKYSVLAACCAAAALVGCGGAGDGPDLGDVSGTVKVDGKPTSNLTVSFTPESGRPSMGTTQSDGTYTLRYSQTETGAKVGKNVVRISSPEPASDDDADATKLAEFIDPIPAKYNSQAANNPEMNVEVKPGGNTFDFNVDSSAAPNTASGSGGGKGNAPETCGG